MTKFLHVKKKTAGSPAPGQKKERGTEEVKERKKNGRVRRNRKMHRDKTRHKEGKTHREGREEDEANHVVLRLEIRSLYDIKARKRQHSCSPRDEH